MVQRTVLPCGTPPITEGRQKVSALHLWDSCLCWDIPDHLTRLQKCHKHNNTLEFHCNVQTSTVVGNMTQAHEVAYAEVYCGQFREVKYTHGVEIILSHETLGILGKNEVILRTTWGKCQQPGPEKVTMGNKLLAGRSCQPLKCKCNEILFLWMKHQCEYWLTAARNSVNVCLWIGPSSLFSVGRMNHHR